MSIKIQRNQPTSEKIIKESGKTVSLPHQWPFPFSNGKKVITPKVVDKKKSTKQDYPEAPF